MTLRIDEVSERAIYSSLKRNLGGTSSFIFLSEEAGEVDGRRKEAAEDVPVVICDPLDGSHNAQVGIPFFSLSLSVIGEPKSKGRAFGGIDSAIILSIKTEDEFVATRGKGTFHNGLRLKRRKPTLFGTEIVGTLLIETGDIEYLREKILSNFSKKMVYKTRLLGSAALSYCMLADGAADAMIFAQPGGARTIDSPAGYLICKEAGCEFTELSTKSEKREIADIEVGFASRMNVLGSRDPQILKTIESKLSLVP